MKSLFARRIVPTCVLSAAAVAALVGPGTASAALGTQCSGTNPQEAAGSSLQAVAQQQVWGKKFNESKAKSACNGTQGSKAKPKVNYTSTSSGKGFAAWDTNLEYGKLGFIGTDNTVNPTEKEALEAEATGPGTFKAKEGVLTIPVAQSAEAIVVNLPTGCTANSSSTPGRLVMSQKTLEGIYSGGVTNWGQVTEGGDELIGASCNKTATITPVVRKDASGTTHIFKRFLDWTDPKPIAFHGGKTITWNEASELPNSTIWPEAITPAEGEKNSGLLAKVAETPSSVGYAVLAEARELGFAPPSGGANTQKFWVKLESSSKKGKATYQDPSSDGDIETPGNSNCGKTVYTNGSKAFPPPSTTSNWNEVTTEQFSKTYALCGLTYDLALANYAAYEGHGTSQGEATTVENYLAYVTELKGGQKEIAGHDYLALPVAVRVKAEQGVKLITWEP
jgi:ABC-type phosphate transport system substrate-binding protein